MVDEGRLEPSTPGEASDAVDAYLTRLTDGRRLSSEELAAVVYEDLHKLAHHLFQREESGVTIQATALVHEAYLRLVDQERTNWKNRAHFMAVAALTMRRLLVNAARDRGRLKRGGALERVTLSGQEPEQPEQELDLLDLEDALNDLAASKPRFARIVELRYFGGLTVPELAEVLGLSTTMVEREWGRARAWLALRLGERREHGN